MIEIILIFVTTFLLIEWINSKPKNYPPGPPCLPLLGSAPFVESNNFHFYLDKMKEKYGPVIGFKMGFSFMIGVAGAKEVKEVLTREEFQGRPKFSIIEPGIMFSEGDHWLAQRRFTVRHLGEFGFSKKTVEGVVLKEADEFFEKVLRKVDVVQVSGLFSTSAINILWAMMGGERYSYDDKEFLHLLETIQKRFRAGDVTGGLINAFPILRKLFPNYKPIRKEQEEVNLLYDFLQKAIDKHKKTKTDTPRDFIDVYLTELEKTDSHPSFNENTLKHVCVDLFSAGAESIGNALSFCILYLVLYPEWQERLYKEIQNYDTSEPYLKGRERLAHVEAFITEVTRRNTIATMAVPHKATKDTNLNGYFIPKGSMMSVSLWSVLQDKDIWKDPKNFRPERFLDENGTFKRNAGWLPAFGYGKRVCPGETLAKNFIFVYLIALIREFQFRIPEGHSKPSTICLSGFTNAPQPFQVKLIRR